MFDPGRIWKLAYRTLVVLCVAFLMVVIGWALFKNFGCRVEKLVLVEYHAPAAPQAFIDLPGPPVPPELVVEAEQ
jgi:hypothetical protein